MKFLMGDVKHVDLLPALAWLLMGVYQRFFCTIHEHMTENLRRKTEEAMTGLINAMEMKDAYTQGHSRHVQYLAGLLFDHLPDRLSRQLDRTKLLQAALLHDIGKISVDDRILKKDAPLTDQEWESNREHALNGKRILAGTCFEDIGEWVLYHHERVDGKGYFGLTGDQIPLASRLIAVADTYSALSTDRAYRKKSSHKAAAEIMRQAAGEQLDGELTELFLGIPPRTLDSPQPIP